MIFKLVLRLFIILLFLSGVSKPIQGQKIFQFELSKKRKQLHDDTSSFDSLFGAVRKAGGGTITIAPGNYYLTGKTPIQITSNTHVQAYGATFHLPEKLGGQHIVIFSGNNIQQFTWAGGSFKGYCFDPSFSNNTWEPHASSRIFVLTTSENGNTANILFKDVSADRIAGAVINVEGKILNKEKLGQGEGELPKISAYAKNISVQNCHFLNCGKFMWDYGFLWQHLVFPEESTPTYQSYVDKYFPKKYIRSGLTIKEGDDKVYFDNTAMPVGVSTSTNPDQVLCLYGDSLPSEIIKGKQYFVVRATPSYVQISDSLNGRPFRFSKTSDKARLVVNLLEAYYLLYQPIGAGPGKGCIDLVACQNTRINNCTMSALGDAMHVIACTDNWFTNNTILSARMGAFFLAEYSKNSVISNNIIDGNNGSRVMSIERSNEHVLVTNNIFRNGGRGSWINQPKSLILQNNIFINNTNKCEKNFFNGRRTFRTGTWEEYAEIYFTTYQKGGSYGEVIIRDNFFFVGPGAVSAIHFEKDGHNIVVEGNMFRGATGKIIKDPRDTTITINRNIGAELLENEKLASRKYRNL